MNVPHYMKNAGSWLADQAFGAMELVSQALTYPRRRKATRLHVRRLAAEIIEVAESIQVDVAALPVTGAVADLARHTEECRQQADEATRTGMVSIAALEQAAGQLHEGHWRIVTLRSDLDAHLAARRQGRDAPRSCRFATGSKPVRSRWASTGSHTRSTPLE